MKILLIKIASWYGLLALLAAFILATFAIITYGGLFYLFLNITGAAGIAIGAIFKKDWPAGILNVVWIGIGLIGLLRYF